MCKPSPGMAGNDLGEAITKALAEQGWQQLWYVQCNRQQVDMPATSIVVWSAVL